MKNQQIKQQISKIYSIATRITIYSAVIITIISFILNILKIDLKIIVPLEWIVLSLMIISPFIGVIFAMAFYISKKNRPMILATAGIITFVLLTVLRGYIFK